MIRSGTRARRCLILMLPITAVLSVLGAAREAAAVDCGAYYGYGAADGVFTSLSGGGLPVDANVQPTGPAAASLVNSGASASVAGAPYPGDSLYTAPGIGGVDPGIYPLAVKSNYPTKPHAAAGQGPVSLKADSAQLSTKADAFVGGGSSGGTGVNAGSSESISAAGCGTSGITADAVSDSDGVNITGTLRIGRIHSEAHAVLGPDGKVKLKSAISLGQVTVAGQTVEINTDGLSGAGQTIPLPNPLGSVLKSQGITFEYVAPVKDPDGKGVTAPGVVISAPLPTNQLPVGGSTTPLIATMAFGRAYAGVNGSFVDTGSSSGTGSGSTPTGSTGTDSPPVGGPGTPTGGLAAPSSGLAAPSSGSAIPDAGSQPTVAGAPTQQFQATAVNVAQFDWEIVYLAITTGAFAVVGAGLLVRQLAERLRWT